MTIELSKEDIEQIQDWYDSAAGESATTDGTPEQNAVLKDILSRLGLTAHSMDVYQFEHEAERKAGG